MFKGYKQADKNVGSFIEDWFVTGDLARQDEDGYFWMTGRAKDLIIRGGHNIDPKIIEDTFAEHPAVGLAAAVGQPDSYAGELPCLYLTLAEGVSEVDLEDLVQYGRDNIAERAANPVSIEVLQEMPLTAVGKIFKPTLRECATERVVSETLKDVAPDAGVRVTTDPTKGLVATVSLGGENTKRDRVQKALAEFTFACEIV